MKYTLKSYVYFTQVDEGVYFRAGGDTLYVRGQGIYPLISKVMNALDGLRTVEEVTGALPDKAKAFATQLIAQLSAKSMLQAAADDHLARIAPAEQQLYSDTLTYLKDNVQDYAQAFLRWREQPVAVAGAGYSLKALVRALARSGVRDLTVCLETSAPAAPRRAEVEAALAAHRRLDSAFTYRFAEGEEAAQALADGKRRAVYVNDALDRSGGWLAGLEQSGRADLLVAGVLDGWAIVGPDPATGSATLADLADRLLPGEEIGAAPYPPVALSIVGNLTAVEMLAASAGIARDDAPGRLGDRFLHVQSGGAISLHPVAASTGLAQRRPMHTKVLSDAAQPEGGAGFAALHRALHGLLDPLAGLFEHDRSHGLRNIPQFHARVRLRLPRRLGGGVHSVVRWGGNQDAADVKALVSAAQRYARLSGAALGIAGSAHIVAAPDAAAWRAAALAQALLRSERYAADGVRYQVDAASITDPELVAMLRILALFTPAMPAMALDTVPGYPAFRALVDIDGQRSSAVAGHAHAALEEALGLAISRLQAGGAVDGDDAAVQDTAPPRGDTLDLAGLPLERAFHIDSARVDTHYTVIEKPYLADATLAAGPLVLGSISLAAKS